MHAVFKGGGSGGYYLAQVELSQTISNLRISSEIRPYGMVTQAEVCANISSSETRTMAF